MSSRAVFALVFVLSFLSIGSAFGEECEDELSAPTELQVRFHEVIDSLHKLGLTHLTEAYDQNLVRVRFHERGARRGRQASVGWHNSLVLGKRNLIIRKLQWTNESERQKAVWAVAEALYRLELEKRLWSARDMFPTNLSATTPSYNLPAVWRDARLADITGLEEEMYALLDHLDHVEASDVLPARDPARRWRLGQTFPNREDRQLRESQGPEALAAALVQRHSRRTIVGYYMDWLKRLAVVGLVTQGLVVSTPYVVDVSTFVKTAIDWVNQPPLDASAPNQSDLDRMRELETEIRNEQDRVLDPDTQKIERLQAEYRDLKMKTQRLNDNQQNQQ